MKTIIKALLVLSISAVFGVTFSFAQTFGTRVKADIPFDFAIGNEVFPAGNYSLSVIRRSSAFHTVQIRDESGKLVHNTIAIQNGSSRTRPVMIFGGNDAGRQLEKLSTPEFGLIFIRSGGDARVAGTGRISVPASNVGPN